MKSSRWLIVAIAALCIGLGAWFGLQRQNQASSRAAVDTLFRQSLVDLANKPQALSQWQGKTLLVNFWATWCAPCVQEMPELSELQTAIGNPGTQIIGIGIDSPASIRAFSKEVPVSYPLYVGGIDGSELTRQFGNAAGSLPFTVLIGPDGTVKKTWLGRLDVAAVRRDIAGL
ncbi:thiol-disulfide isomerase/thioredoxin [Actimicrobium sp. GrIS 1.19]|uniref:TlpA family protein disulfide reductase n=1 Tax=Actimicrobium sp. GrIS 1.19 TaxID=3071708 RepID=UPI002DFCA772|nr:thiol-disulfide isomerase/thioredoxin [Actimicrobium sp. GrIS 1.19]